jgi:hypothetical protein
VPPTVIQRLGILLPWCLWQPDKWHRLRTVAALAGETSSMVDVGGRGAEMRRLASAPRVTSVNVEAPCDVLVRPGRLPFPDGAFDTAVSCDVLEHVPGPQRPAHVAELLRVAQTRVVVCFPCGSDAKDQSERRLADRLATTYGVRFDFLAHGLPRPPEVVAMVLAAVPDARVRVLFQDGVREAEQLLTDAVDAVKGHQASAFFRSVRGWFRRRQPRLTERVSADNNRAYLVIDLPG